METALRRALATRPGYAPVGLTEGCLLAGDPVPDGWNRLRVTGTVGQGASALAAAAECVLTWGMHRGAGLPVRAELPRAVPGSTVVVGIGPRALRLLAPCRVVWAREDGDRRGFGYATLPGHPEVGEEGFLVERHPDDRVTLTVLAYSRPGPWWLRLVEPAVVLVQNLAARRYIGAVRRAVGRP